MSDWIKKIDLDTPRPLANLNDRLNQNIYIVLISSWVYLLTFEYIKSLKSLTDFNEQQAISYIKNILYPMIEHTLGNTFIFYKYLNFVIPPFATKFSDIYWEKDTFDIDKNIK